MNVVREDNKDKPATWKQVWCLIYAICGVERGKTKNPPLTQACFIDVKELWKAGKLPRGAVSEILSLWKEADLEQIDAAREQALLTEGFELLVEMVGRDFKWPHYTKELQDQEKPPAEADQRALVQQIQDVLKDYN